MTQPPAVSPHADMSPGRRTFALFALALGGFGIGSAEFSSMGMLPDIARTLLPDLMASNPEVGISRAGVLISAYALGVVVGAPVLALVSVRVSQSRLIRWLAGALAIGTILSATMPTYQLTIAARFLAGVPHGAYFGVASLLAASIMGPGNQGKGVALALSGLTVANLVGVPLFTFMGQTIGWRASYGVIAAIFALTVVLLVTSIPAIDVPKRPLSDELVALKRKQLWAIIAIACIGFAGTFAVFSYISDIATKVAGAPASFVPWLLVAGGLGMTLGNILGGRLTDRSLFGTLLGGFPVYLVALALMIPACHNPWTLMAAFFFTNLTNSVLNPAMNTWLIRVAGPSEVLGASLHHAAFNVANALGAALGGAVIAAGHGYAAPTVVALVPATVGFVMTAAALGGIRMRARSIG